MEKIAKLVSAQKWSFPLRISSVNVTKSAIFFRFVQLETQIKETGKTIGTITFSAQFLLLVRIQTRLAWCLRYPIIRLSKMLSKLGKDPKPFLFLKFESIITKTTVVVLFNQF